MAWNLFINSKNRFYHHETGFFKVEKENRFYGGKTVFFLAENFKTARIQFQKW